jgi:hypothetical protein
MLAKKKKQLKAAATAVYAIGQMAKGASEAATPIKDRPLLHRLLEDGMVLIMLVCLLGVLWLDLHLPAWFAAWLRSLPDGARGFLLFVEIGGVLAAVHLGIAAVVGDGHDEDKAGWMPHIDEEESAALESDRELDVGAAAVAGPAALPDGWVEEVASSGEPCFRNVHTHEQTWVRPLATQLQLEDTNASVRVEDRTRLLEDRVAALSAALDGLREKTSDVAEATGAAPAQTVLPLAQRLPAPGAASAAAGGAVGEQLIAAATEELLLAHELLAQARASTATRGAPTASAPSSDSIQDI